MEEVTHLETVTDQDLLMVNAFTVERKVIGHETALMKMEGSFFSIDSIHHTTNFVFIQNIFKLICFVYNSIYFYFGEKARRGKNILNEKRQPNTYLVRWKEVGCSHSSFGAKVYCVCNPFEFWAIYF